MHEHSQLPASQLGTLLSDIFEVEVAWYTSCHLAQQSIFIEIKQLPGTMLHLAQQLLCRSAAYSGLWIVHQV